MEIIETPLFAKRIREVLSDDEYGELQWAIVMNPRSGKVMPGTRGLRKLRWVLPGKGKSGGIRIIYYVYRNEKIYMLIAYKKSEQENLTPGHIKILGQLVQKEFHER